MALFDRLRKEIKKKWPRMQKKKVRFYQNNGPCHKSIKTMMKINELHLKLLRRPPEEYRSKDYWLCGPQKDETKKEIIRK